PDESSRTPGPAGAPARVGRTPATSWSATALPAGSRAGAGAGAGPGVEVSTARSVPPGCIARAPPMTTTSAVHTAGHADREQLAGRQLGTLCRFGRHDRAATHARRIDLLDPQLEPGLDRPPLDEPA